MAFPTLTRDMLPAFSRESWKTDVKNILVHPGLFIALWLIGGALSVFVPLKQWNKENDRYYRYYGQYNQNDDQNGNDDQNNNNNNNNGDDYYYQACKWYQWSCKATQYNYNNGDGNNDEVPLPVWWIATFGGVDEEERREQEENAETPGALKFVYVWSLLIFVGILLYGVFVVLKRRRQPSGLLAALFIFTNYAILSMLMLASGVISDEGRQLENTGFYGQFGVLMFLTYFWFALFGVISSMVFGIRYLLVDRAVHKENYVEEDAANSYQSYTAPEVNTGTGYQA
jgi:hypothetical protein